MVQLNDDERPLQGRDPDLAPAGDKTGSGVGPHDPSVTSFYTMTELARIKGVSYHTVSRAVRRGRLPAHRIGRMAMIAPEDAATWHPLKERAPRRYRPRQLATTLPPLLTGSDATETDLSVRLAAVFRRIHEAVESSSLSSLGQVIAEAIAGSFGFSRVTVWTVNDDNRWTRLAMVGTRISTILDERLRDEFPNFQKFLDRGRARVSVDLRSESPAVTALDPDSALGPMLLLPMSVGERTSGFIVADRDGERVELSTSEIALVESIAVQAALALEHVRLREREQRQRAQIETIFDELSDAVRACDTQGRIILLNRADRRIFGSTNGSIEIGDDACTMTGTVWTRQSDGEVVSCETHPLSLALDGADMHGVDYLIEDPASGQRRQVQISAWPLMTEGTIDGALYVARDVTRLRSAERRDKVHLEQIEAAARRASKVAEIVQGINETDSLDSALGATIRWMADELDGDSSIVLIRDPDSKLRLHASHNVDLATGFMPFQDPIDKPHTLLAFAQRRPVLLPAGDASPSERAFMEAQGARTQLIVPLQLRDQTLGAVYVNYATERTEPHVDTTFAATIGRQCSSAIEKLRLIEEKEEARRHLSAIIEQAPQAVLIFDAQGVVILANHAAEQMWGREIAARRDDASKFSLLDMNGDPIPRRDNPLLRPLLTGVPTMGEPLTLVRVDGTQIQVLGTHSPITDVHDHIIGAITVLLDREDFKPLDRAKNEFLSVVAHELRNPLTSLRGNLQLIQRRLRRRDEGVVELDEFRRIGTVLEQVDRISELVGRLLDVSRVDLGRLDLAVAETDASEIVQSVVSGVTGLAPNRPIRVTAPDRLPVVWDQVRVEQILLNVIQNAVRYAPDGPIDVGASVLPGDRVEITIRDYGDGVPDRIRSRLFKQYYRFDDGVEDRDRSTEGTQGLGIGLYISSRFARIHGGTLDVENAEGGGALFRLRLPRVARAADVPADQSSPIR